MKTKHRFTEKAPIGAAIGLLLAEAALQAIVTAVVKITGLLNALSPETSEKIGMILAALLFLFLMRVWYSPQYQGVMKSCLPMKETLLVMLPCVVYSLTVISTTLLQYSFSFQPSFQYAVMGLMAGIVEETVFRVTGIPVCMGFLKSEKRVWLIPAVTAVIFGLSHLGNVGGGATLTNAILQAIVTGMIGFSYGVLFVVTGSALPGILIHSMFDFCSLAADRSLDNGIMTITLAPWEILFHLVLALALTAGSVAVLKRIGSDRILEIWRKKWSQEED